VPLQRPHCEVTAVEVDHYLAVHRGGTDDLSNLVSTCRACHKQKTANEAREARR
jgi:5-methylcytosine-specific restriction protein A